MQAKNRLTAKKRQEDQILVDIFKRGFRDKLGIRASAGILLSQGIFREILTYLISEPNKFYLRFVV